MGVRTTTGRVVQEVARLGVDGVRRGGRGRAADVDAATLTALLGRRVDTVRHLGGTSGTTDRARLALGGDGVPASVFVKSAAPDAGTRLFGGLARLGEVEVGFYRDLRPALALEAPAWLGGRFDRATGRFLVVLEDLAARGATFVDTLTPLSADRAARALDTQAALHAATHEVPTPPWLVTGSADPLLPVVSAVLPRLGRRVAAQDPALVARGGDRLLGSYRRWAPLLDDGPRCVLHGDPHPGNTYVLGTGDEERVGLLDWQAVRRGHPLRDVAYLLVLGLETEVRRTHERDLLTGYLARLAAAGGPSYGEAEAWLAYRRMAAYAYVASTFTVGLGGLQEDDVASTGLRRAVATVEDLDSAAALGL